MCLNLDPLIEKIEVASKRAAEYQQRVAHQDNQNVKVWQFKSGDWVLKRVNKSTKDSNQRVLGSNWKACTKSCK